MDSDTRKSTGQLTGKEGYLAHTVTKHGERHSSSAVIVLPPFEQCLSECASNGTSVSVLGFRWLTLFCQLLLRGLRKGFDVSGSELCPWMSSTAKGLAQLVYPATIVLKVSFVLIIHGIHLARGQIGQEER